MTQQSAHPISFPDPQPDADGTLRLTPHFFLAGERKCGTSSLFRYLIQHPDVLPGFRKEPDFFAGKDLVDESGFSRYLANFPPAKHDPAAELLWPELDQQGQLYEEAVQLTREPDRPYVTGDASANTFHEGDPELVKKFLPEARIILIFRDPVERAFSHHRMFLRFQEEGRELGRSFGTFEADIQQEMENPAAGEFLAPGCYLRNLERWDAVFPRHQRLVLFSEDLDRRPQEVMNRVFDHLGLPAFTFPEQALRVRYNQAPPSDMPDRIRDSLRAFYEPFDAALGAYLQQPIPWMP